MLGLLHELMPAARVMGALLNPNATDMDGSVNELEIAARSLRVELRVLKGGTERQIDEAFAGLMQQRLDALYVANDPFLSGQSDRIISHAARLGLPTRRRGGLANSGAGAAGRPRAPNWHF